MYPQTVNSTLLKRMLLSCDALERFFSKQTSGFVQTTIASKF